MIQKSKGLYLAAGFVLTALAAIGIVLPLLPTTPFLLLAAWCFSQSSEKCHRWLVENKHVGPLIRNWQNHRCIPKRDKIVAIVSVLLFGTYAVGFAIDNMTIRIIGGVILLTGLLFVLRIPVCKKEE